MKLEQTGTEQTVYIDGRVNRKRSVSHWSIAISHGGRIESNDL